MDKTVTFSFSSTIYEGIEATETFNFKELGIDENLDNEALKIEIERIFQAWVWDKLNISFSIVINKDNP
ncbi:MULTISPECIES: hypothetical protein [Cytobacillus]|uniref:Uncharacterized protein n=1 Tax=Cytobacillus kochii TaxID=859143 RepID=A0A248TPV9_9BACI|nr:hypothetical protein [Cytobacillus kochii]ASV70202.1 hypothetical protein CKF48_23240 [Cytobacillus kochii]MDM5207654.1 hypothetical protein [Cytobacillus kochii]MDQ0185301.1 hypothetical protein [Cytobacillus kochii]